MDLLAEGVNELFAFMLLNLISYGLPAVHLSIVTAPPGPCASQSTLLISNKKPKTKKHISKQVRQSPSSQQPQLQYPLSSPSISCKILVFIHPAH